MTIKRLGHDTTDCGKCGCDAVVNLKRHQLKSWAEKPVVMEITQFQNDQFDMAEEKTVVERSQTKAIQIYMGWWFHGVPRGRNKHVANKFREDQRS
jgi:hypothetical protein